MPQNKFSYTNPYETREISPGVEFSLPRGEWCDWDRYHRSWPGKDFLDWLRDKQPDAMFLHIPK
jgi:hypothetical protein